MAACELAFACHLLNNLPEMFLSRESYKDSHEDYNMTNRDFNHPKMKIKISKI